MAKEAKQFINMPRNHTEEEKIKRKLFHVAQFPGVIRCIDGTHSPVTAPPIDEYAYVNRKNFHSINVQAVCDANMIFLDVVAKWPGSHHDSFIQQASGLHEKFERDSFVNGWLLKDSGYPLRKLLMITLANPASSQEQKYNTSRQKACSLIEKVFGILKSRWRILDEAGVRLCYAPERVSKIVMT